MAARPVTPPFALPVAAVTPARLRGMARVRALDPVGGGPGVTIAIPGRSKFPRGEERTLVVHIAAARADTDLAELRAVIAAAAG